MERSPAADFQRNLASEVALSAFTSALAVAGSARQGQPLAELSSR